MATAFLEDFETDGNGTRYTTSIAEYIGGTNRAQNNDFVTRTDDSGTTAIAGRFTNTDGFWFGVSDFDGAGNATQSMTLDFEGIDIAGLTDLSFSGLFAEFDPNSGRDHWDANTQVFIEVSIDGAAFTKIMQFASDSARGRNNPAAQDTDFDGVGDGTVLSRDFTAFDADIAGTGSSLDLRITFENLTQGNEDFHLDNLSITGTETGPQATADAFTVTEGAGLFVDLLGNDSDPQSDALSIISGAGGGIGLPISVTSAGGRDAVVIFAPGGALNFAVDQLGNFDDLDGGETDTIEVAYTISDGSGGTDSSSVTVTIEGESNALQGNELPNRLIGTDGDDELIGNEGNDVLDGEAGADTMDGGLGNDIFFVDNAGDVVIEAVGEGYDRVNTTVSRTLAENVEMGTALGTADIDLTGNAGNNWLNGNAGANSLSGLDGADRLHGGDGSDVLNGGAGNDNLYGDGGVDRFVFNDNGGIDVIRDLEVGETIDLSGTSAADFASLSISDHSSGSAVDYGSGLIILTGIAVADVTEDYFAF
ncbi:MAG: Ig-like domain-containing protein [Pseudomonadota bacterium]